MKIRVDIIAARVSSYTLFHSIQPINSINFTSIFYEHPFSPINLKNSNSILEFDFEIAFLRLRGILTQFSKIRKPL